MKSNPNFNLNKQIFLKCKVNCVVFSLSALGMVSLLLLLLFLLKENVKEEKSTHVWTEIITKVWKTLELMIFIVTEMLLKEFLLVHWKNPQRFQTIDKDKYKFKISSMKTRYYNCYYNSKVLSFKNNCEVLLIITQSMFYPLHFNLFSGTQSVAWLRRNISGAKLLCFTFYMKLLNSNMSSKFCSTQFTLW